MELPKNIYDLVKQEISAGNKIEISVQPVMKGMHVYVEFSENTKEEVVELLYPKLISWPYNIIDEFGEYPASYKLEFETFEDSLYLKVTYLYYNDWLTDVGYHDSDLLTHEIYKKLLALDGVNEESEITFSFEWSGNSVENIEVYADGEELEIDNSIEMLIDAEWCSLFRDWFGDSDDLEISKDEGESVQFSYSTSDGFEIDVAEDED